jgi:hypothetical protein
MTFELVLVFIKRPVAIVVGLYEFLLAPLYVLRLCSTIQVLVVLCPYSFTSAEMTGGYSKMRRNYNYIIGKYWETLTKQ